MKENPLYESAGAIRKDTNSKSVAQGQIYSDMFEQAEEKPDNNHQYVDIGNLTRNNDTAEVDNPLYATLS